MINEEPPRKAGQSNILRRALRRLAKRIAARGLDARARYVPYPKRDRRHQVEFRKQQEEIFAGYIPPRFQEFADVIPGQRILDIGCADGTLAMALGRTKESVIGLDLMAYRVRMAKRLRAAWLSRGEKVQGVQFHHGDVTRAPNYFSQSDTVVLSRTLYHLRDKADWLMEKIQAAPTIRYIAILGNRDKEKVWKDGVGIAGLESYYLSLASLEGMVDIVTRHGFDVTVATPSGEKKDPIVVATRRAS